MFLYHYYDSKVGPFVSLSDLPMNEAKAVLASIQREKPHVQSAKRHATYVEDRRYYEEILKAEFIKKGGLIKRPTPHYMVVGHSVKPPWFTNCPGTWFTHMPPRSFHR